MLQVGDSAVGGDGDASGASKLEYAGRATRLVRVIRLVRLIKLLRILRVVPLFKRVQRRLELRFAVLRIVKCLTPIPLAPRLAACCAVRALRCAQPRSDREACVRATLPGYRQDQGAGGWENAFRSVAVFVLSL